MGTLLSILTQNVEAFSQMAKQWLELAEFLVETGNLANYCLPTKAVLLIAYWTVARRVYRRKNKKTLPVELKESKSSV